jgi:hypothetical protein
MDLSPLEMLEQNKFAACITFPRSPHYSCIVDVTRNSADGTIQCNIPSKKGTVCPRLTLILYYPSLIMAFQYYTVHVFSSEPVSAVCEIWTISPMARNELKVLVSRLTPKRSYYTFKTHGSGRRLRTGDLTRSCKLLKCIKSMKRFLHLTCYQPSL